MVQRRDDVVWDQGMEEAMEKWVRSGDIKS